MLTTAIIFLTALGLSRATAYRHWTYARAWLRDAVSGAESG